MLFTTVLCYNTKLSNISIRITPGTEKTADNPNESQLRLNDTGKKYEMAHTAHTAPIPPKALTAKALKKCLLILKTSNPASKQKPAKIYISITSSPVNHMMTILTI